MDVTGTGGCAAAAARVGARLFYVSTDYVFDGTRTYLNEQDMPHPLNHYGMTKWLGEQAVLSSGAKALVIRTAWVYGQYGREFRQIHHAAAQEQPVLRVVHDSARVSHVRKRSCGDHRAVAWS